MADEGGAAARVTIVGGGYTGAACAVQLVRACPGGVAVTIVEPRAEVGRGLAYTAPDPDHRLNGSTDNHVIDLADPGELNRWCAANGILDADPDAASRNGNVFIRRHDFGRFVGDMVRAHSRMPGGSAIAHVRDTALDAHLDECAQLQLASGATIASDLVVIATGNPRPRFPQPWAAALEGDARGVGDPLDNERIRAIASDARVLLVGTGLTALDVMSTLLRQGHRGPILAMSRRGLRPALHRLAAPIPGAPTFLERVEGPVPSFVEGAELTARGLLRALRMRIRELEAEGGTWYAAFDAMRDVVWRFWPRVPAAEKRRFQRFLRAWYDMHRFRAPPQNDAMVREAQSQGRVRFAAGRAREVRADADAIHVVWQPRGAARTEHDAFDVIVNCTGLDAGPAADNHFLLALQARGLVTPDASGIGFAVDADCRPVDRSGRPVPWLRMFGPPTAGTFGDPLGVLFISPQIRRAVPAMRAFLGP